MSCALTQSLACRDRPSALSAYQLETELSAALHRERTLAAIVEQQRAEIDSLRSLVNALRLTDTLRSMTVGEAPSSVSPSLTSTPQRRPLVHENDDSMEQLHLAMKRVRVE